MAETILLTIYVLQMSAVGDVPPAYSVHAYEAATAHGVDPYDLGSYLISEHRGSYSTDKCSDAGACGLYQLTGGWVSYCEARPGARERPREAAHVAACVIAYSQESHDDCDGSHDWRAHMKCGPGGRDTCTGPVGRWQAVRERMGSPSPGQIPTG